METMKQKELVKNNFYANEHTTHIHTYEKDLTSMKMLEM